jgi:hypothetical protein
MLLPKFIIKIKTKKMRDSIFKIMTIVFAAIAAFATMVLAIVAVITMH